MVDSPATTRNPSNLGVRTPVHYLLFFRLAVIFIIEILMIDNNFLSYLMVVTLTTNTTLKTLYFLCQFLSNLF